MSAELVGFLTGLLATGEFMIACESELALVGLVAIAVGGVVEGFYLNSASGLGCLALGMVVAAGVGIASKRKVE